MGVDSEYSEGLVPFQPGGHGKFYLQGWSRPDQKAGWEITCDQPGDYAVNILVRRKAGQKLRIEVLADGKSFRAELPEHAINWQRIRLQSLIPLSVGPHRIAVRMQPLDKESVFNADFHALEFVRPEVEISLQEAALSLRSDITWFQQARYGIFVHWTSQSMPHHGEQKPYAQAVADFNAEAFADQMKRTGAGFVVLTTSHAFQYFPAPIASLDKILPRRTAERDLVADLSDALSLRGIKLMLYYHLGAASDEKWLNATHFWESNTSNLFGNWKSIISEVGQRYKTKLAGWWFDDGATSYYYRSAPWEELELASKAGHAQRLVGFNAWELNNPTLFHDFFTGEGFADPRGYNQLLVRDGSGRYLSGTHQGLQSSACMITEEDWGHFSKDRPIGPPRWNAEQLAALIREFAAYRNVPIFNLEIYQDGTVSPQTVIVFEEASRMLNEK
ncbi:MAG TPA: alpha-L-fucosidase [Anaerohalosphaeraceae bacterium]|nr:alpha-L-fucosidase [Anaerohalosphaeraceae bacterium]